MNSPALPDPAPPNPVLAIAEFANTLGRAATNLADYRRDNPTAPDLDLAYSLETGLYNRAIELRHQAIALLGDQAAEAVAQLQDATQRVDAFFVEVTLIGDRLVLASAVITLAAATLKGDPGAILTAVVGVHDALKTDKTDKTATTGKTGQSEG